MINEIINSSGIMRSQQMPKGESQHKATVRAINSLHTISTNQVLTSILPPTAIHELWEEHIDPHGYGNLNLVVVENSDGGSTYHVE